MRLHIITHDNVSCRGRSLCYADFSELGQCVDIVQEVIAQFARKFPRRPMNKLTPALLPSETLVRDLRGLISDARRQTAAAVNVGLTLLYWRLGERIRREVLGSAKTSVVVSPLAAGSWE